MKKIFGCRRTVIALFSIACLTFLGAYHGVDISGIALAIAGITGSVAGANAFQAVNTHKHNDSKNETL